VGEGTAVRLVDLLRERARLLVERLDADAAVLSRAVGDVLLIVAQFVHDCPGLETTQSYLVSDYPQTQQVLVTGEPCVVTLEDPDVDEAEARLLREFGVATLLMLPLQLAGERWGLVEVYRRDVRPFGTAEVAVARELAQL
jgi:transcriptional regulator with GAF, ATPase, and Fis domain